MERAVILELCGLQSHTAAQLCAILQRKDPNDLTRDYLGPMREAGELALLYPESPSASRTNAARRQEHRLAQMRRRTCDSRPPILKGRRWRRRYVFSMFYVCWIMPGSHIGALLATQCTIDIGLMRCALLLYGREAGHVWGSH